jgi:DNA-binding NarL/FixJ family response regulator
LSGAQAIAAIKSRCPSTNILVFTVMENDDQVFSALRAGASGYLLKDAPAAQIVESIEEIRSGGAPMSFPIARKVLSEFRDLSSQSEIEDVVSPLSKREVEILECLYKGDSYKEIADKLSVSIHTVHTHIKNIYNKFHVNSRAQAIYEAVQQKIIRH